MPTVKKAYGPNVTLVGKSKRRQHEPDLIDPEITRKLAILKAVIENGKKHGLDRLDELAREQAKIEKLKLEGQPNPIERGGQWQPHI